MSSESRQAFMRGLAALRNSLDQDVVREKDDTGDFIRRGLTVASYNLLETFVINRMGELATHVNEGSTQFLDLPDRLQTRAIRNTLEVARSRLRYFAGDSSQLRQFSADVGSSLVAVDRALHLSPYAWLWSGSNMTVEDYEKCLQAFHVAKPWQSVRELAGRLGFPALDYDGRAMDYKSDLSDLLRERHRCAHDADHGVTTLWIRALPQRITRTAVVLDILVSVGAGLLKVGDPEYLANDKWLNGDKVRLRFVRERERDHAEYREGSTRALRRGLDRNSLLEQAASRCSSTEALVQVNIVGELVNWSVPRVS